MPERRTADLVVAATAVLVLSSCSGGSPAAPPTIAATSDSARTAAHLVITGNPEASLGATWTYRDTVDGTVYDLTGILLKPAGGGRFPAIIVSHGAGGSAGGYSRSVGTTMVRWGAVVIGTNYTHAGSTPVGAPGTAADQGASAANVLRAQRMVALLRALGYVDMNRVAAHGHSMGAFVTVAFAAASPGLLRVASHTAGGVRPDVIPGAAPSETQGLAVRTPYQMHHGDRDQTVALSSDQRFDALLQTAGTTHELHVYPGADHNDVAMNATVLERVRAWYGAHGIF